LPQQWFPFRFPSGSTVDEPINRFMPETHRMMGLEISADLFWAEALPYELRDQAPAFLCELTIFVPLRVAVAMSHAVQGPVRGIKMARRIGIPLDLSPDRRGMTAQRRSHLFLRGPFTHRLPDGNPFFLAEVLVVFHRCRFS